MQENSSSYTDSRPEPSAALPWLIAVAFFMQMLDSTILNTALPSIARSLQTDPLGMHYIIIAYTLTVALLIPASGWLADRYGTKKIFIFAVSVFTFGSLLCAGATSLPFLIGARVVQGFGGALMVPVGRLVVLRAYPRNQLLPILSFITIPGLIGPLIGPILGGMLVEYLSCHWIFLNNLPVGIVGCALAMIYMPDFLAIEKQRFDLRGFLLVSSSVVLFSIGLEGFGELNLRHAEVLGCIGTATLLMFCYWLQAVHSKNALFPPQLFQTATFAIGISGNLFCRLASGALPFLTPLFLQLGFGFSPIKSGLSLAPLALAAIFGKIFIRKLTPLLGYRRLLTGNTLLLGALVICVSQVTPQTPYWQILLLLTAIGASNSLQFTAMSTMTLLDLPEKYASSGNAMLSVVMQLSISIGIAMAAGLLQGFEKRYTDTLAGGTSLFSAFSMTYICLGIIAITSSGIFMLTPREAGKAPAD